MLTAELIAEATTRSLASITGRVSLDRINVAARVAFSAATSTASTSPVLPAEHSFRAVCGVPG
jgi:hypothetical protein